jgi:hypothetical protein|tara:strand:- start:504 stop:1040 length:537 start_codon:yes stop_codon:yes gene_type:complete
LVLTKITNGQQTSKIILNELGNKELRERHTYSIDKGEHTPFHHMRVTNQTPIDQLLIEKTISIDQHHVGIRYTEVVFKSGAYLRSPSWEFRDMKNNHTPPPPPTRALILTGVQKYLQKQASPRVEILLWNVVAKEKTPRDHEIDPLRFGLDILSDYWYPRRKTKQEVSLQKMVLQALL